MSDFKKLISKDEIAQLDDMLRLVKEEPQLFKKIVLKVNRILYAVWQKAIHEPFFYYGKIDQFTSKQRLILFKVTRQRPSISTFSALRTNVEQIDLDHPIKARMIEVLDELTPLVLMIQESSPKKVYENATLRTCQ